jgi:DNA mismatch repair protein MutS2
MMEERYLVTLEFPKIAEQLARHTSFSASQALALALRPSTEEWEVRERQQETTEAKALLAEHTDIGVGGAHDVRALAERAELGARLLPQELLDIRGALISARTLRYALQRLAEHYPLLGEKASLIEPLSGVIDDLNRCLDDEGRVPDAASPTLARLRHEAGIARGRLLDRLHHIIASGETSKFLQEPIVTERNRRFVIPLRAEFKGRIPGIIQDQSSSGATLFIEPLATVELNNQWQELLLQERQEVDRILTALSHLVGGEADWIIQNVNLMAEIDLALAKAKYSYALRAWSAEISPARWPVSSPDRVVPPSQHPVHLIQARHPLLPADTVVPIDVYLGGNGLVLLVTGPNTGGKTVSLKTVGLLAAMNQAGLHIPVADGSRLPIFDGLYADIGDEQSIEQSLSTFSSHMTHIIDILGRADRGSLVLLDELGAGTDPVEGAALAQAIILELVGIGCLTMCSSHYSELKVFAFDHPLAQNASVEFNVETLSPTFRLTIGLPGRSNAFAIAQRLGLSPEIIETAQSRLGDTEIKAEVLLSNVKAASDATILARQEAEQRLARVAEQERGLREKLANIEEARRRVLDEAREQGRRELERVRIEIKRLQQQLIQQPSATEAVREAVKAIEALEAELPAVQISVTPPPRPGVKIQVGDTVYVSTLDQTGELLRLEGEEAEVRVGGFRLRTHPSTLEYRSRPVPKVAGSERPVAMPRVASPGLEMDLRGMRAEEVGPTLDKYLDNACLAGLPWVNIIHGKGTGVLKAVVRERLGQNTLVVSFRPGELSEGGDGVTVAQLANLSE